ncbi:hypothetical protein VT84_20010 [Gemmata sp. SH-PL17]|uniref:super-infection exclusion protein B n=1 Tax=Gemmata sp. SH-PL17 TaxID=1630693 RepID=UPI00078BCA34|nr:super-infection exclusion protein B [Gemmata sp. SH-PL17]AMV26695.1 hypothetical protein VT84_20010 [Gemmata sp. SH-PL17]
MEFAKLLPSLLEAFKANGRKPLVVAGLVAGGLLFGFEMRAISGQTGSFVEANWHWLFILLLSVGAMLLYELVAWLSGRYRNDDGLPRQQGKRLDDVLKSLTQHELSMLGEFIRRDERTLKFCAIDSAIRKLLKENLITMHAWDQMTLGGYHDVDCTIQDFVWNRLQDLRKEYLRSVARQSEN